ncbi:MAG: acetyl-CoA decarbonylase/synthase complex subunit gamma [Chloroflexi bacterium]|nr:acetyl-CoA decarbonylase/synthase complex subunit gamma [Chloroflexota bacterium]
MALSGIQIYKLLPQTNCKECGFPTCLAFAMKLAAKQVELDKCPDVSDESRAKLAESAAPPVRLVTISADGREVKSGNEIVLFRHEKTFYNPCGIFIRLYDDEPLDEIKAKAAAAAAYSVDYVGMALTIDGFAVQATGSGAGGQGSRGAEERFAAAVNGVLETAKLPLILIADDPAVMSKGLEAAKGTKPLLCGATPDNWQAFADLAKAHHAPMTIRADSLSVLADLTEEIKGAGVQDIVLDPSVRDLRSSLMVNTLIRRMALKKTFRPLGFPIISFPSECAEDEGMVSITAAQAVAKYGGFIVLDRFSPATVYPLLVLRSNIYTDPQKPIQVQPGIYEINDPQADSPVMVTTNFSITYFSVANEIDGSGLPGWLLVADAEGMSVLTAWAAGKFDAEKIAKTVKTTGVADKVEHRKVIIPGHVAVLLGELEEELPGWEIKVGPREAVDITAYLKAKAWQ